MQLFRCLITKPRANIVGLYHHHTCQYRFLTSFFCLLLLLPWNNNNKCNYYCSCCWSLCLVAASDAITCLICPKGFIGFSVFIFFCNEGLHCKTCAIYIYFYLSGWHPFWLVSGRIIIVRLRKWSVVRMWRKKFW